MAGLGTTSNIGTFVCFNMKRSCGDSGGLLRRILDVLQHIWLAGINFHTSILNSAPYPVLRTVSLPPMFFSMMLFAM